MLYPLSYKDKLPLRGPFASQQEMLPMATTYVPTGLLLQHLGRQEE